MMAARLFKTSNINTMGHSALEMAPEVAKPQLMCPDSQCWGAFLLNTSESACYIFKLMIAFLNYRKV
jgi:hypothetical protein